MLNSELNTIEHIYDAAIESSRWQFALDALAKQADARACALLMRDFGEMPYSITALSSVYVDLFKSDAGKYYVDHLSHYETQQWEVISRLPVKNICRDEEMGIVAGVLDQRPDYKFLRRLCGIHRRVAYRLNQNKGWFDGMTVGFGAGADYVPVNRIEAIKPLLPHLAKSVELGRTFSALKAKYNAVLTMLDQINIGIILALGSGEILLANSEAERILSMEDGLERTTRAKIACQSSDQTEELNFFVGETAATAAGEGVTAQRHMAIERPSGKHAFMVEVTPVRDGLDELNVQLRGAMVVVIDPDRTEDLKIKKFTDLYGLTKAESNVCDLLIKGKSAIEIAEVRSTAISTSKSQIKAVYAKTGINRRGDLIRLIVRTLPPVV